MKRLPFFLLAFFAGQASAAGLSPLLNFHGQASRETTYLAQSLRDPIVQKSVPQDASGKGAVEQDLQRLQGELKSAKGPRRAELLAQIFEAQAVLVAFNEDQTDKNAEALKAERRKLVNATAEASNTLKQPAARARVLYIGIIAEYFLKQQGSATVAKLDKIREHLNSSLRARSDFLKAYTRLNAQNGDLQQTASRLGANASLAGALASARVSCKAHRADSCKKSLQWLASRLGKVDEAERESSLMQAFTWWNQATGFAELPFDVARFGDTEATLAARERLALKAYSKGQLDQASRSYRYIQSKLPPSPAIGKIEERLLMFADINYRKTHAAKPYEKELLAARTRFQETSLLGNGHEAEARNVQTVIATKHRGLVDAEARKAAQKSARPAERQQAIGLIATYLTFTNVTTEKESLQERMAYLYSLNPDAHSQNEAVRGYMALATDFPSSGKKNGYLNNAFLLQAKLSDWPPQPPWAQQPKAGRAEARKTLLDIAHKLREQNSNSWLWAAHEGLLQNATGQESEAYNTLAAMTKQQPSGEHARHAIGWILAHDEKANRWTELEQWSRFAMEKHLAPLAGSRPLDPRELLGVSLFLGGKKAYSEKNFALATSKFEEFVRVYPRGVRKYGRDEGLLFLAQSQQGKGDFDKAIESLQNLSEQYPRSKFLRAGLLLGGQSSEAMAWEDNAQYFWTKFLKAFPADQETETVRDRQIHLQMGRSRYGEAARWLETRLYRRGISKAIAAQTAQELMGLYMRHGSLEQAAAMAAKVLRFAEVDAATRGEALSIRARYQFQQGDMKGLTTTERALSSLDSSQPDVRDALSQTRFYLGQRLGQRVKGEFNSLELTDPMKTLNNQYAFFLTAKDPYERACSVPQASYCAPALSELARLADTCLDSVNDLSINETLDQETVKAFAARKDSIENYLTQEIETADNRSVQVLAEGASSPEWTEQILWQNATDWNFSRLSGQTSNGFIQWQERGL